MKPGCSSKTLQQCSLLMVILLLIGTDLAAASETSVAGESPPRPSWRARDIGVPFEGQPGPLNAITDVAGVEVGHSTIIKGGGELKPGEGPVRTGVTVIFPLGRSGMKGVAAGIHAFNGDGEMTGTHFINEFGELHGPMAITNTLSVGSVHQAIIQWSRPRAAHRRRA